MFLYIKLHQSIYLYFPFLFPSSVLWSFFSFSASSLFGTKQQLTRPLVKSSTFLPSKRPVFQGGITRCENCLLHPASSLFGAQEELTHPPQRAQPFLSGRCLFFRTLHLSTQIPLYPASSLFGTQ